ncbi:hypothetical protein BGX31_006294 [Mortierella sp. GBA43]|nr:hypothetical protein BGX31_006294 [Mortierella sp. GBA43]
MKVVKEHCAWVNSTNEHTIEKFSIKFGYSEPRAAYYRFTNAVQHSRLKNHAKQAVLDSLKVWKENKSHATLFWADQERALRIKEGKSIVGASLVAAATEELPEIILSEASYSLKTRDDSSTATSSTSSSSKTPSSRLSGKRSVEQAPDDPNKKQRRPTQKGVIAGTSRNEDHDRDHDDYHVHHHSHDDEDDDHDNSDADNTADFLSRSLFNKGEKVDQYFFESPVSAWKDTQVFCKKILDSNYETSCMAAFRRYTRSLLIIAKKAGVEEQVQNCAREAFNVREACFRTQYTSVVNQMAQQAAENIRERSNGQEAPIDGQDVPTGEKSHLYVDLLNNQPLPFDPSDGDFLGGPFDSRSESDYGSSLDLTGEIPVPIAVDHLVGPGTLSSQISSNSEDHLVSHG